MFFDTALLRRVSLVCLLLSAVVLTGCRGRIVSRAKVDPEAESIPVPVPDVPTLIGFLSDPDPDVRFYAAVELARKGPQAEPAVEALTKALSDGRGNVRSSAAD